jgi:parvulin-like peptidyl-prolyl isomerase
MKRMTKNSLLGLLLTVLAMHVFSQEPQTIDRIIATVNRTPVLLSEWEDGVRFEAFSRGRPPQSFNEEEKQAALTRLIDRVLLLQQMQADYSPTPEEVSARILEIRKELGVENSDLVWQQLLAQYGMTANELKAAVENQMKIMRFVDLRLRPTIRVDRSDIDQYYRETLVPELKKSGVEPQPEEQVQARIRELLVQQRMDAVLEDWLVNLRSQTEIHFTTETGSPSSTAPPSPNSPSETLLQRPNR